MLTLFSFILMWLGSLNWFFISAFQYDFIAGFFGTQSSLFSRFIYFLIGMAGFIMVIIALKNRGKIKLIENPFKKKKEVKENVIKPIKTVPDADFNDYEKEPVIIQDNLSANDTPPQIQTNDLTAKGYKDFDASKYDN